MDPDQELSGQVHLGKYIYSRQGGKLTYLGYRPGFRQLTRNELKQLMRRLHAAPKGCVTFLDLSCHEMGADMMRKIAVPIAELEGLLALILSCSFLSALPAACAIFSLPLRAWLLSLLLSFFHCASLIADNAIGPAGCGALAEALPHLSSLQVLYLSGN
jgi:Ran GTPase-activating protein (RanGAP) involved in mRNA processing and transport